MGLGFVLGFHALLIWGLFAGLARKGVELLPHPIETRIIEAAVETLPLAPPPLQPDFTPPPAPTFRPPALNIAVPPPPIVQETITPPALSPAPTPAPVPKAAPVRKTIRVAASVDFERSPRACREPAYPSVSARRGEAGTAQISLLIGTDGKVEQSRIDQSSGHRRLDEATIKAFSRCKFIVASSDGVPEPSWFSVRYQWIVPR